jgi:hypothetical protein
MGIRICQDEVRRDRVRELGAREGVVQEEHVGCEHSPRGFDLAIPQGLELVQDSTW